MAKKKEAEEAGTMSKADAVRAALAEGKTKPQDACAWIKEKFDIDITPQHFSSYKSQEVKKQEGGTSGGGRRAAEPAGQRVGSGNPVELAKQVRALVQQHGAAAVKGMVEVFE